VRRRWRWLLPLAAVPVLALLAYGFKLNPREIPSPLIGRPASPFTLTAFDGSTVDLAALRGKIVVVNFWASWCPPCVEEMPSLNRFAQAYAPKGVEVVAISVDDDPKAYKEFLDKNHLTLVTARDPDKKINAQYGTFRYPETYIADRQGRLVRKIVGEANWLDPRVIEIFDDLLKN
jgi:thiol-disulfide isomerase/thioredoxin